MANPYIPVNQYAQLKAELRDLKRRFDALEASPQLTQSSVKGGKIAFLNDELDPVGHIGRSAYYDADGAGRVTPVLQWKHPTDDVDHLLVDDEHGFVRPYFPIGFSQDTYVSVATSSWTNCWKGTVQMVGLGVYVRFLMTADSGTVGEYRLEIDGNVSDVLTCSAGTQTYGEFKWDLTGKVDLGEPYRLRLQAHRLSGSNSIHAYAPDQAYCGAITSIADLDRQGTP
jgi:hypothetical protein